MVAVMMGARARAQGDGGGGHGGRGTGRAGRAVAPGLHAAARVAGAARAAAVCAILGGGLLEKSSNVTNTQVAF